MKISDLGKTVNLEDKRLILPAALASFFISMFFGLAIDGFNQKGIAHGFMLFFIPYIFGAPLFFLGRLIGGRQFAGLGGFFVWLFCWLMTLLILSTQN